MIEDVGPEGCTCRPDAGARDRFPIGAVVVFLVVLLVIAGGVVWAIGPRSDPLPAAQVASPLDGCDQFFQIMQRAKAGASEDTVAAEMQALAEGLWIVDATQAGNIQFIVNRDTPFRRLSDFAEVIYRRCLREYEWRAPTPEIERLR